MNRSDQQSPRSRTRLLRASAGATVGVVIAGVAGTAAAAAALAHQQLTTETQVGTTDSGGYGTGTSGVPGSQGSQLPGLSSSTGSQQDGGSNGS